MGKGIISDDHPLCVAAARSKLVYYTITILLIIIINDYRVLNEADVIVLIGARLNWILHFGRPPRFQSTVKFIQVFYINMSTTSPAYYKYYYRLIFHLRKCLIVLEVTSCYVEMLKVLLIRFI